jgi:hypothetical protein
MFVRYMQITGGWKITAVGFCYYSVLISAKTALWTRFCKVFFGKND